MKKILLIFAVLLLLTGCAAKGAPQLSDGTYTVEVQLDGGTGRAYILSPACLEVEQGQAFLTVVWSSPNYDYMIVDGTRYDFITVEGGSTFRFPVSVFDAPIPVIGDTLAMSTPHEIDYTLTLIGSTIQAE